MTWVTLSETHVYRFSKQEFRRNGFHSGCLRNAKKYRRRHARVLLLAGSDEFSNRFRAGCARKRQA